jgi:hypothetical protein
VILVRVEYRSSVLNGFDFNALDDPDFQEDSVREEIITPILKGLGYAPVHPFKIIRSKKLLHPFVSIGSVSKKIHIIPDYLLAVDGRYAWTLEAKAPAEAITASKHVEQAYSYAIHSEIRVPYFALCNGREFVLYHISKPRPVIQFDLRLLSSYWENLVALLGPARVLNYDSGLAKDLGLHLKRLGFDEFDHLFRDLPVRYVGKLRDDLFTFGSGLIHEGTTYVASFDFSTDVMEQLAGKIPESAMHILREPVTDTSRLIQFPDATYRVNVECQIGDKLEENEDEIFLPFRILRIAE